MNDDYRLYSFVAGLALSGLQRGLQTAHVIGEMSSLELPAQSAAFSLWAKYDKTIIICDALTHGGVLRTHAELEKFGANFKLPVALFREDEETMNFMATACGIIVPKKFYGAFPEVGRILGTLASFTIYDDDAGDKPIVQYYEGTIEYDFCAFLKSFRLAQS